MYTSSKQDKEKYVGMTLDSKLSTLYPPNTGEVIDSNDETEITENCLEDYCESMIDYNHTNFHMIRKTVKKEHRALRASIYLFKKSNLPYWSTNYLIIAKVAGSEMIQINVKDTS